MEQVTRAVRGAIQIAEDTAEAIGRGSIRLVRSVLDANGIREEEIISLVFSLTTDLTRANPATGLRSVGFGDTALFCVQEARVEGQLPRVIRLLVTYRGSPERSPRPVYLDGAAALRPDLTA